MKKLLFTAFALLFAFGIAMAQDASLSSKPKKTVDERSASLTRKMTKELNLDQAQQERVGPINLDRFKKIEEAKSISSSKKEELATKVKAINEEYTNTIKGVLSADQFTKFLVMQEEAKKKAFEKKQDKK